MAPEMAADRAVPHAPFEQFIFNILLTGVMYVYNIPFGLTRQFVCDESSVWAFFFYITVFWTKYALKCEQNQYGVLSF